MRSFVCYPIAIFPLLQIFSCSPVENERQAYRKSAHCEQTENWSHENAEEMTSTRHRLVMSINGAKREDFQCRFGQFSRVVQ